MLQLVNYPNGDPTEILVQMNQSDTDMLNASTIMPHLDTNISTAVVNNNMTPTIQQQSIVQQQGVSRLMVASHQRLSGVLGGTFQTVPTVLCFVLSFRLW